MSVKRYDMWIGINDGEMVNTADGDYVLYEDYAKLLAALKEILAYEERHGYAGTACVIDCARNAIAETERSK